MPILAALTDFQAVSLLLYKNSNEIWADVFPYVYSQKIFSSSFTQQSFYSELFSSFCNEHGIKLSDCEILFASVLEGPRLNFPNVALKTSLTDIVGRIESVYPIFVSNNALIAQDFCEIKYALLDPAKKTGLVDVEEQNYYANLDIYPQIVPMDMATQVDIDSNIATLLPDTAKLPLDKPLLFCGPRFSVYANAKELDYMLILNLIRHAGIYHIQRDPKNLLLLKTLLKMYKPELDLEIDLVEEGTVVSTAFAIECKLDYSAESSQLVDLVKDKILVIPVEEATRVQAMIKSKDLGVTERTLVGGHRGIIFDTRQDKKSFLHNLKFFSDALQAFNVTRSNLI